MPVDLNRDKKEFLRSELEATRSAFHALLDSLSDEDLRKRSGNPGWTNGELLSHIMLAFIFVHPLAWLIRFLGRLPMQYSSVFARTLNWFTSIFNWVNAVGARAGGAAYDRYRIGEKYDRAHQSTLKLLDSVKEDEWDLRIYYPTEWDDFYGETMTFEALFRYVKYHFELHRNQISR
jgi:hypothetical protein